ncbi:hypothetical protein ACFFRR_011924 [Megaselia abdita]
MKCNPHPHIGHPHQIIGTTNSTTGNNNSSNNSNNNERIVSSTEANEADPLTEVSGLIAGNNNNSNNGNTIVLGNSQCNNNVPLCCNGNGNNSISCGLNGSGTSHQNHRHHPHHLIPTNMTAPSGLSHHQLQPQQQQQTSDVSLADVLTANASNIHQTPTTLQQQQTSHCGYCCQPISDRYIMRVVDTSYHEGCLKCSSCASHLVHSCFQREGKLFCRIDYERFFLRNRCLGCGDKIGCDELVMRTLENVFHLKCFACVVCGVQLKKGEQYVVKQGQLFCRFDYEKEVEMLQGYEDFYGDDLFPPKMDGRRGPKRPRTILNTQQRRAFKASFELSPKPCRKVRENLAKETGLSLRIVQVWFQNQRAKVKKIQKKAKQENKVGNSETDSQESDNSLAKIKDENLSDDESMESPFSTPTDKSNRLIKEEVQNENSPFNCPETNKENCNKNSEPILNTILGLSYATFQQLMGPFGQTSMLNPIDRLYSMQSSYFRPEDLAFSGKDTSDN